MKDNHDFLLCGLMIGIGIGILVGVLIMKEQYADSIIKWNEVTYKYSYCPYCGEKLGIAFDEE